MHSERGNFPTYYFIFLVVVTYKVTQWSRVCVPVHIHTCVYVSLGGGTVH